MPQRQSRFTPSRFTLIESLVGANRRYRSGDFRATRSRFTLIELLVVVAIIAVLAAMLLPALSKARDRAVRVLCLADRKQNGLSIAMFTDDYNGYLPSATTFDDTADYAGLVPSTQMSWHPANGKTGPAATYGSEGRSLHRNTSNTAYALGTLARLGYIGDPKLLFCPAYTDRSSILLRDGDTRWSAWVSGDLDPAPRSSEYGLGITHLLFAPARNVDTIHWSWGPSSVYASREGMQQSVVAAKWQSDAGISPFQVACLTLRAAGSDADENFLAGETISHKGVGLNAVVYDGAARWITQQEVAAAGWLGYQHGSTAYPLRLAVPYAYLESGRTGMRTNTASNFPAWARRTETR